MIDVTHAVSEEDAWEKTPLYEKISIYITVGILYVILWVVRKGPFFPPILPRRSRIEVTQDE